MKMRTVIKIAALLAIALAFAELCFIQRPGPDKDTERRALVSKFRLNMTEADALARAGRPDFVSSRTDGVDEWTYDSKHAGIILEFYKGALITIR